MCFVDLTQAYDSVDRTLLWTVLARFGVPPKLLANSTMGCERASGRVTADVRTGSVWHGLRQGCVLAPLLLNIFFTAVLRVVVERFSVNAAVKDMVCTKVKENKGGGKKRERPEKGRDILQETGGAETDLGNAVCRRCGIVSRSRNSLAKMMADIVAMCASFGLTVSEAKTDTMCLMTKGMDRVTFVTEAAGQVYKQAAKFVYLGATVCENIDLTVGINRRVLLANLRLKVWPASTAPAQNTNAPGRGHGNHIVRVCYVEPHRWPIFPYCARLTTDCSSAALDGR